MRRRPRSPARPRGRFPRGPWLLAAAVLTVSACDRRSGEAERSEGAQPSGGLTPDQSAQVLVRVGDRAMTLGDYAAALEHMSAFDRMRYQAPERRRELLHEMIDVMLLADEARARGYDKEPMVEQEVREVLRDAYFAKAREAAPKAAEIPEGEVRAYYDAHRGDFHDPERRRVSAVVLQSRTAAASVLDEARTATPVRWGEIVRARSTDPQAKADVPADLAGDLGFVSPPGDERGTNERIPEAVRAAVFEVAAVGDVVPRVVPAEGKFYVVRYASRSEARDRTLVDAERAIRVKLAQQALAAKEKEMIDELRRQYPVEIDEAVLARVAAAAGDAGPRP